MLSLHNPFDVLGDTESFPEEIVDELMYGEVQAEAASGEIRAAAQCSECATAQDPVPESLPELHSPPELDFDKTQKLDWVWDFISREWVDPGRFPAILAIWNAGQPLVDLSTARCLTWLTMVTMRLWTLRLWNLSTTLLWENS